LGLGRYELLGMGGAVLSGLSMALIAEVRRTDGAWEIFAAFSAGCLLVSAPMALVHPVMPSPSGWACLLGMGLFSVAAQLLMTYAMRFVEATISGVVNQLTPAVSLIVGWVVFDEHFGLLTACGIALTMAGGVLGAYLASRKRFPPT
jgi:drug/metabolite transporter (DMT)-like permease